MGLQAYSRKSNLRRAKHGRRGFADRGELYNPAKADGLTLGSVIPALYFNQLAGKKEAQFDWCKFQSPWILLPIFRASGDPKRSLGELTRL